MYSILFIVLVLWSTSSSLPVSDSELSPEFIQEEENTLSQLDREAQRTELKYAWEGSKSSYPIIERPGLISINLSKKYRDDEFLNEAEIRILISYCDESDFYTNLNTDLRENGGKQYPVATKVMKAALTKLKTYQKTLHTPLYRAENISLFESYQNLFKSSKSGVLKQFTSTSTRLKVAEGFKGNDPNKMITKFEDPQIGASIVDFSEFDECEVLLPVSGVFTVKTAIKDENNNYDVVLIGPRSVGTNKHNSNIFMIFMSALIIKTGVV